MMKLRELLRLKLSCQLSSRQIGRALQLAPSTIGCYVNASQCANLTWPAIDVLSDSELLQAIEPHCRQLKPSHTIKADMDFLLIHKELKRKGVTKLLLREEYKSRHGNRAYSYNQFCSKYRTFKKTLKPSMRQIHVAGEKAFVDYAGPKIPITDPKSGRITEAVIFVGVLGASNYTFAEATLTRSLPDWIGSHNRMFDYFGGVPTLVISDNEKAGVTTASYYDPEVNPQYTAMAAHYGVVILPTRPRKPKDKAKVEVTVQIVERWILAKLRKHTFFSLNELNDSIKKLLVGLNKKPQQKLDGSREKQFLEIEKPALKPIPVAPYEYADIKKAQVRLDYHVEINNHYYSVPCIHIGQTIYYHVTQNVVKIYHDHHCIATHLVSHQQGKHTTIIEHMPEVHRQQHQWTPQVFINWALKRGSASLHIVKTIISQQPHPECCYRIHLGLRKLAKQYGDTRFEAACFYAHQHQLATFKSLQSILKTQADKAPCSAVYDQEYLITDKPHENIRGANYYSNNEKEAL